MSTSTLWPPDRQGYICHWLAAGPLLGAVDATRVTGDQFAREAGLRAAIANRRRPTPPDAIRANAPGRLGVPWRFCGGRDGAFVNLSAFYPSMHSVRFDAATALVVPEPTRVDAVVWTYAAADVFLNGAFVGGVDAPRYAPIQRATVPLDLRAGENLLYIACETLGARDTRSVVGVQIQSPPDGLRVTLPDADCARAVSPALALLESARIAGDALHLAAPAPEGTRYSYLGGFEPDYAVARRLVEWTDISGQVEIPLRDGEAWVTLEVPTPYGPLSRRLERTEQVTPILLGPAPDADANLRRILSRIADVESLNRDDGAFGFPISNILARKYLAQASDGDAALFDGMLDLIERRVDCADFLMSGLIRYLREYPVPAATTARIRRIMLGWRYWMDMDGADGMCFWSENHSLMFYSCAMFCGAMYPDDRFTLANMTGRALSAWGRARVAAWLSDAEERGFEEFNSAVYMCLTFVALLNLVDYADKAISARAARVADDLLRGLARHTFRGGFIAPMGRVYRGVLYPFAQGAMALMNLADGEQPYDFGEGWLGFYATSRYRLPDDLKALMASPASLTYTTGNARIVLEKRADWCLTSVACPREPFERWPRVESDDGTHAYAKSRNEHFHGTTDFRPGGFGYQQHLWTAALDGAAILFANHPGATSEDGDMRPGYWHGNGAFPAISQRENTLGAIYRIPDAHPIRYIHVYAPRCRFDAFGFEGQWLFASRERGFVGFWTSGTMEPWTGVNADCEWRVYGDDIAALCVCGGSEFADLPAFKAHCRALDPRYGGNTLVAGTFQVRYTGEE